MCGAMYRARAAAAAISCRPCSAARSAFALEHFWIANVSNCWQHPPEWL